MGKKSFVYIINRLREEKPELYAVFTAQEECNWPFRDKYGRFLARYTRRIPYECEVSDFLFDKGLLNIEWPKGTRFAVVLTHDVDFSRMGKIYAMSSLIKAARQSDLKDASKRFAGIFSKKYDPLMNFRRIMMIEAENNTKSTFFFLVNKKDFGGGNNLEELVDEINFIVDKGWEIGLHLGYFSYDDPNKIASEKRLLENVAGCKVRGVRNHLLRFSVPRTWEILSEFFDYDSTFGYADHVGFRNGMCHPFKPCTPDGKIINIWEIPLTVTDTTFIKYMNADAREAFEWIKLLTRKVEKVKGVITLLWHNTTFDELVYGEYARMYRGLLRYFKARGAWLTNCGELYDYWVEMFE
jgi:peptidoglycan/xylan/chitin deacetylase (PgdA/CDA1 family)